MNAHTDSVLGIDSLATGQRGVSNKQFAGESFDQLVFGPNQEFGSYVVSDCSFVKCTVVGRSFVVREGVVLRNVIFDSIDSYDPLTIYTTAVLDHVTIRGRSKRGGLWIKPPEEIFDASRHKELTDWVSRCCEDIEVMLDISGYQQTVDIYGIPVEKVVIDPERHVILRRIWSGRLDWRALGLSKLSPWIDPLSRLDLINYEAGIYDLPSRLEGSPKQTLSELQLLRDAGIAS